MIFRDTILSECGNNLVLYIVGLGIFGNTIRNPYLVLGMTIVFILVSDWEISSFILNSGIVLIYVINNNGNDYNEYMNTFNGLVPIELLFILSFSMCMILYIGFRKKSNQWVVKFLPFILLANTSLKYMSMGVLRNLTAFALWNISESFIFIIPFFHTSTFAYIMVYYLKDMDRYRNRLLVIVLGVLTAYMLVNSFVPSNFFRVTTYITKWGYFSVNFWNYGNWKYYVLVSTTSLIVYWKNHRQITIWMVIYCFMFVYVYHYNFMIRMVYISFFAMVNILIRLDETPFNKKYLLLLSLYFLTSVVP